MQISKDKCGGAPNGNCQDVDFNIRTGTKFFADTLNGNGGNLLLTLGNYNGWPKRMTIVSNHWRHRMCKMRLTTELTCRNRQPRRGIRAAACARTTWTSECGRGECDVADAD